MNTFKVGDVTTIVATAKQLAAIGIPDHGMHRLLSEPVIVRSLVGDHRVSIRLQNQAYVNTPEHLIRNEYLKPIPIDLRTCKSGQKLRLRDGTFAKYVEYASSISTHRYVKHDGVTQWTFDNGQCSRDYTRSDDVIEILPFEESKLIDLSTCKPGRKLRLRDGSFGFYHGADDNNPEVQKIRLANGRIELVLSSGTANRDATLRPQPWDVIEILSFEESKPAAPSPKTAQELYLEGQKLADFKVGERVKIAFHVPGKTNGWDDEYSGRPDWRGLVDKIVTVHNNNWKTRGIEVVTDHSPPQYYLLPWFCLERVKSEPVTVKLNEKWTAEIVSKTEIRVGCQTFPVTPLRSLFAHYFTKPQMLKLNSGYMLTVEPRVTVAGEEIPVENLKKLLAAADAFQS